MNLNQNKVTSNLVTCHRCEYEWTYKGNNPYYCCCPFCRTTIRIGKKYHCQYSSLESRNS